MKRSFIACCLLFACLSMGCETGTNLDAQVNMNSSENSTPVNAEDFFSQVPEQLRGVSSLGKPKSVT